jgi:hypothetical protein
MATRKTSTKPAAKAPARKTTKTESKAAEAPKPPATEKRRPAAPRKPRPAETPAIAQAPVSIDVPTDEERYRWIAHAAYLRAERRGFTPGQEVEDWLAAEAEFIEAFGLNRA